MPYKTLVMSMNAYAGSEVAQAESLDIKYSSRPCAIPGAICLVNAKDYASPHLSRGFDLHRLNFLLYPGLRAHE